MDWDGCVNLAQSYLENSPLIVLGSGASMPYGLPSMRNLAEAIEADPVVKDDPEFANLCQAIDASGLEAAIDSVQLRTETIEHIRTVTWETINRHDTEFFDTNQLSPPKEFVELLNKVIAPAPNKAVVVTTNYDRLPEYAADGIDATSITGFEGSILRKLEIPVCRATERDSLTYKRIPFRYFDERFSESLTPTHEKESFIVSTNLNAFLRAYAEPAQDRGHLCAGSCSVWEQAAAAPRQNLIFHRPAHSLLRIGGNLCRIRKTGKVLDRRRLPSETPEKHDQLLSGKRTCGIRTVRHPGPDRPGSGGAVYAASGQFLPRHTAQHRPKLLPGHILIG